MHINLISSLYNSISHLAQKPVNFVCRLVSSLPIIIALMLPICSARADEYEYSVKNITNNDGLSNNTVRDILQDSIGHIWFCTPNGLNRYDGTSIKRFTSTGPVGQCLADTRTRRISEDGQGHLWISSMSDAFSCYDMQRKCFVDLSCGGKYNIRYTSCIHIGRETWLYGGHPGGVIVRFEDGNPIITQLGEKSSLVASNYVNFVKKGIRYTWIGTEKGLYRYDEGNLVCQEKIEDYIAYLADDDRELFLTRQGHINILRTTKQDASTHAKNVSSMKMLMPLPTFETASNQIFGAAKWQNLWIVYCYRGCLAFDIPNERFCPVPKELYVDATRRLIRDNKGGTWVSDAEHNLLYIGLKSNVVKRFSLISSDMLMQTHEFFSVFHGSKDIIWISTTGNGLFAYNVQNDKLTHFSSSPNATHNIPTNHLKYVYQDRSGSLWLGTSEAGALHLQFAKTKGSKYLSVSQEYDSFKNQIRAIRRMEDGTIMVSNRNGELYSAVFRSDGEEFDLNLINRFNSIVYCTEYDAASHLWVGTKGGGLYVGQKNYTHSPSLETSLSSNNVTDILRDDKGRMWISTFGGGLNYAIPDGQGGMRFRRFFDNTEDCNVRMICRDHNGWLWLATSNGIIVFEPDHLLADPNRFVRLQETSKQLRTNEIRTIFCDHNGTIWISETGKGLACCNPTGNYSALQLEHYTATDGIVMPMIQSFEEDRRGRIWISTEHGMFCFDPKERKARGHYFSYDMMRCNFCENSSTDVDGRYLLFGSNNGVLMVDTEELLSETYTSEIRVSGISLDGMEYTNDELSIPHDFNSLEIRFSIFDFSSPMPIPYIYMLEGADTCWSQPTCNGCYLLNGVPEGNYKLHVRAFCEGEGWSEELILPICIEKPLWREWWFIAIYIALIILTLYVIRRQNLKHRGLKENYKNMETKMQEVKKMFVDEIISNPSDGPNSDKQFLETLEAIVKEEIGNPDFTSEQLAIRMNMSHTTFYNTANRLLGKSPKEYIRHYRMKEAARLLVTSNNNVSQIAFMVGYNDVSYFSKNFKKYFDMSPLRYKEENSKCATIETR